MRLGFSKMLIPLATLAISFSHPEAQADESDYVIMNKSGSMPTSNDSRKKKSSSRKYSQGVYAPGKEKETSCNSILEDCGFNPYGEVIYWIPSGLDLDYSAKRNATTYTEKNFAKYEWHPGFKLGLIYKGRNAWDFDLYYLYIRPNGNETVSAGTDESLISTFDQQLTAAFQRAKTNVRLVYMHGDLDIGRRLSAGKNLALRFLFGLRGSWIEQKWESEFFGIASRYTKARNKWNLAGAGSKVGTQILWKCYDRLLIYGKTSFAAMIVGQDINHFQTWSLVSTPPLANYVSYTEHKLAPMVDFETGLSWARKSYTGRWGINLVIGYQWICWWNVAKRIRLNTFNSIDASPPGNLYLQGLVIRAGFGF